MSVDLGQLLELVALIGEVHLLSAASEEGFACHVSSVLEQHPRREQEKPGDPAHLPSLRHFVLRLSLRIMNIWMPRMLYMKAEERFQCYSPRGQKTDRVQFELGGGEIGGDMALSGRSCRLSKQC